MSSGATIIIPGLFHPVEEVVSSGWEQMKQMILSAFVNNVSASSVTKSVAIDLCV
jgi:hypothetical protein